MRSITDWINWIFGGPHDTTPTQPPAAPADPWDRLVEWTTNQIALDRIAGNLSDLDAAAVERYAADFFAYVKIRRRRTP